jgi:catechol 2,3-dioxygenase-like lactoylglutathione lyase family enzyme
MAVTTTSPIYAFVRAMPVLETSDLARALAFYKEKLGFSASTWGDPPCFAIVQRGTTTIALNLVTDAAPTVTRHTWAAYLYVADVDALYAELRSRGVAIESPPENRPYPCREIAVDDPDGHIIAFGQDLAPDALGPGLSPRIGRDSEALAAAVAPRIRAGQWSGGCQCGAVRFRTETLGRASLCHCRMCQKAFGSVGGLLVTVPELTWTRGRPSHFQSSNKVRRGFCSGCGTPLTFEYDGKTDVAIAAFDDAAGIAPVIQMARGDRLPFVDAIGAIPVRPDEAAWRANWVAGIESLQHPDHDTDRWPPEEAPS